MKRIVGGEKKFFLKNAGVVLILIVLVTSVTAWAFSPKKDLKPSEYGIGITYERAMKDKKPFIVMFYADWCTYCMRFMPKYKVLSEIYKDKYNFVMINADNLDYYKVVKEYAIGGFPTIYIIDPTIDNRVLLNNTLYDNLRLVRVELDRYLRIRALIP